MATQKKATPIGLAVIGCGTIGRIRAILAQNYPAVEWLGLCDLNEDRARSLGELTGADFYTTDAEELLSRPEVNATIIATDETGHPQPTPRTAPPVAPHPHSDVTPGCQVSPHRTPC